MLLIFGAMFGFCYLAQSNPSVSFLDGVEENIFLDANYVSDVFLTAFNYESELLFDNKLFAIETFSEKQQQLTDANEIASDSTLKNLVPKFTVYNFPMKKLHSKAAFPKLKTQVKMGFNAVDLALGKNLLATRHLAFCAYAGAKTAWTDYRDQVRYWGMFHPITSQPTEPIESFMKNKSLEIGPRIGIDGLYRIGRSGMALQTNAAVCLLLNNFDLKPPMDRFVSLNEGISQSLRPVAEIYFGFDWNCPSSNRQGYFNVSVGYEAQYWWDRAASLMNIKLDPNADLTFQGFLIKARMSF